MRLELSGGLIRLEPLVVQYDFDQSVFKEDYIDLGYTHFEVVCIGAGGTRGGGIDTAGGGTTIRSFGGAGGGGGFHRIRGLLSILPDESFVIVGQVGINGTDASSDPDDTTDGTDGGYSSFNNPTCRASGGTAGSRVHTNSDTDSTLANGGEGGVGDAGIAGGGALGGIAGTPSSTGPGISGSDGAEGTLFHDVGKGGGGGAGGVGKYGGITCNAATAGGRGSYNPGNTSIYGPKSLPTDDIFDSGAEDIIPGEGGGAKASPLNGLSTSYGKSGFSGVVIIRFTAE